MLETPHVAIGIAIATKFSNPWVSIPLSLASHFVLDKVPHWNPHTFTETKKHGYPKKQTFIITTVDIFLALVLGLYFASQNLPDINQAFNIIACSFFSVLPDVSKYPFFLFKKTRVGIYKKWVEHERRLQVETQKPFWGIVTQILVIIASMWWITP